MSYFNLLWGLVVILRIYQALPIAVGLFKATQVLNSVFPNSFSLLTIQISIVVELVSYLFLILNYKQMGIYSLKN